MARRRFGFDIRQAGRQIGIVFLVVLIVNVAASIFLVRPTVRAFRTLQEDSAPQLNRLRERQREVEAREAFLQALVQAQVDLKALREEVLSTRQRRMVEVQVELAKLARQFNINLERVQYENDLLEDEGLERFAMVVPLEGGYANLRKFIEAVEKSERFLVIERVALGSGQDGGTLLQLNITLATYFDVPELREDRDARPARRGRT